MPTLKISHSALEKYRTCPRMYRLHYVDKIRPTTIPSPLFFGNALDEGLNILLGYPGSFIQEQIVNQAIRTFHDRMIPWKKSLHATYSKHDLDFRLFGPDEYSMLRMFGFKNISIPNDNDWPVFIDAVRASSRSDLLEEEIRLFNYVHWVSLIRKGELMIQAYHREIIPKIRNVVTIQKDVELANADGDKFVGKVDFIAEWEDGKTYIFDNKTSSKKYAIDSVRKSPQLMCYSEALLIPNCGFIVLVKNLSWANINKCLVCGHEAEGRHKKCANKIDRKRCGGEVETTEVPRVVIQVVLDEIQEQDLEALFENISTTAQDIKDEQFAQDFDNCYQYGQKCPYYDYCRSGSMDRLAVKA